MQDIEMAWMHAPFGHNDVILCITEQFSHTHKNCRHLLHFWIENNLLGWFSWYYVTYLNSFIITFVYHEKVLVFDGEISLHKLDWLVSSKRITKKTFGKWFEPSPNEYQLFVLCNTSSARDVRAVFRKTSLLLVHHVSTTWAVGIFRVKWRVFVSQ